LISDSNDHLKHLRTSLAGSEVEITSAISPAEFGDACRRGHDLAVVAVGPGDLPGVLRDLRTSRGHAEISVLVEASRLSGEAGLAGLLPQYRAMPCSPSELITLVRRRTGAGTGQCRRTIL
jgi:hypothetical protein